MSCNLEEYFPIFDSWKTQYLPDNEGNVATEIYDTLNDFDLDMREYDADWAAQLGGGDIWDGIILVTKITDDLSEYGFTEYDWSDELHCYTASRGFCFPFANRYMALIVDDDDMERVHDYADIVTW